MVERSLEASPKITPPKGALPIIFAKPSHDACEAKGAAAEVSFVEVVFALGPITMIA